METPTKIYATGLFHRDGVLMGEWRLEPFDDGETVYSLGDWSHRRIVFAAKQAVDNFTTQMQASIHADDDVGLDTDDYSSGYNDGLIAGLENASFILEQCANVVCGDRGSACFDCIANKMCLAYHDAKAFRGDK